MMKQLYIFALAQIVAIAPAFSAASLTPSANGDQQQLRTLEGKFFTHEDVNRTLDDRLANLEVFVFGAKRTGTFHDRIARLAQTCSNVESPAYKMSNPAPAVSAKSSQPLAVAHQPRRVIYYPEPYTYASDEDEPDEKPIVTLRRSASVRQNITVVDRIEWLEVNLFGRKDCAGKIQKRVAKLENCVYGLRTAQTQEPSITARVNKLWCAFNASSRDNARRNG